MFVSSGNEIKIWDLQTNDLINEYPILSRTGSLGPIHTFNIRPDNNQIAAVIDKDNIKLINLDSNEQIDLNDTTDPKSCAYDSTGRALAVGTKNSFIELHDFKSQTMKKRSWKIQPSCGSVNCLAWSKSDRYIAGGNSNGSIVLYNTVVNQFSNPLLHPKLSSNIITGVTTIQYSARNPHLASGYDDGSVILWDTNKDRRLLYLNAHNLPCTSVLLSPINSLLMLSAGLDSIISFHDYNSNKTVKTIDCKDGITSLDMFSNGCNYCVGSVNGFIYTYDLRYNTDVISSFKAHDTVVHCVKYFQNFNSSNLSISKLSSSNNQTETSQSLTQIKKSNSFTLDLQPQQQQTTSLPTNRQQFISNLSIPPQPINIYSPENQKGLFKLKPQSSSGNIINLMEQNGSDTLSKTNNNKHHLQLSSTVNSNTPQMFASSASPINNSANKLSNFQKISKQRGPGDMYSPLNNGIRNEILNDDNPINGTLNFNQASPKFSSTQLNTQTPKHDSSPHLFKQSTVKISVSDHTMQEENSPSTATNNINNKNPSEASNESKNTLLPLHMIREIVKDSVEDFKDELMSENFKFKAEILKEFMILKRDIQNAMQTCSINEALVEEIQRLKEENKRLRKMF